MYKFVAECCALPTFFILTSDFLFLYWGSLCLGEVLLIDCLVPHTTNSMVILTLP